MELLEAALEGDAGCSTELSSDGERDGAGREGATRVERDGRRGATGRS